MSGNGNIVHDYLPIIEILNGDVLCINLKDKKYPVHVFSHEDDYKKHRKIFNSVFDINKSTKIDHTFTYYK